MLAKEKFLAAFLCCLMVAQPEMGYALNASKKPRPAPVKELQGDDRIVHALNRFTFGPRPGDIEAVKKIGLDKWFETQLNPASLDETELTAQLANYPSIQKLSVLQLMERFPNERMIRAAMNAKFSPPDNTIERKIYDVQIKRLKEREADKAKTKEAAATKQEAALTTASQPPTVQTASLIRPAYNGPNAPVATADKTTSTLSAPTTTPATSKDAALTTDTKAEIKADKKEERADDRAKFDPIIQQLLSLSAPLRVKKLLAMSQDDLDTLRRVMRPTEKQALLVGMEPEEREITMALEDPRKIVIDEMASQRVIHDLYSNAQLEEVMADFWLNHFNIFLRKNEEMPYYLTSFERDVIRPRALGKFEDLLLATAESPAMMLYLDNAQSIGPDSKAAAYQKKNNKKGSEGLNENYARELMELHTVGVNGGYTQADVTEVARMLTGWGVDKPQDGGGFKFFDNRHQPGSKTVMGVKFKEDGQNEGLALIHMLANKPETARFISRKLAIRFVSDNPPESLVNRMADSYLASHSDIKQVLRTMFHSPEFWNTDNYRAKVKTPSEYVLSAVRAAGISPQNPGAVANTIRDMGMQLYGSLPPTGYTWKSDAWLTSGALVQRMNYALSLTSNHVNGCSRSWTSQIDPWNYQNQTAIIPTAEEARLENELISGGISEATRAAILRQLAAMPTPKTNNAPAQSVAPSLPPASQLTPEEATFYKSPLKLTPDQIEQKEELIAGLLLGSPEFQKR